MTQSSMLVTTKLHPHRSTKRAAMAEAVQLPHINTPVQRRLPLSKVSAKSVIASSITYINNQSPGMQAAYHR
jgi:hypothetical protein